MHRPLIEFVHPEDVGRTLEEAAKVVRPDHQPGSRSRSTSPRTRSRSRGCGGLWWEATCSSTASRSSTIVGEVAHSARDRAVVRGILAIAREFDLPTVAEGVEDAETLRVLRHLGVDHVQGYLVGRPEPLSARSDPPH